MPDLRRILLLLFVLLCGPAGAEGYADLAAAIRAGDAARVSQMLASGVPAGQGEGKGAAPLLIAASRGHHEIARMLLAAGAAPDPRLASFFDATPLMLAVNNRDLPMARLLLEAGADVNRVDRNGDPALNWACFYGDLAAVELLLQFKADATISGHGNALEVSMRRGHQPLVERLVDVLKLRLTPAPPDQRLIDAIDAGDVAAAKSALEAGANPDALDGTGRPVLARAARRAPAELVAVLLAVGANPNAADRIGFTPLIEAARDGRIDATRELLRRGADVNRRAAPNGLAMTALHAAAAASPAQPEMLRLLVKSGARIDALDAERATPLAWAINADEAAALTLVDLGADPDIAPKDGDSPRRVADQRQMEKLLAAMERSRPR